MEGKRRWIFLGIFMLFTIHLVWGRQSNPKGFIEHHSSAGRYLGLQYENYAAFLGIRYAKANRWELPVLTQHDDREPVFNATHLPVRCPQSMNNWAAKRVNDEDCLMLNLYTPLQGLTESSHEEASNTSHQGLPVFVFFHGGAFIMGSASDVYIDGEMLTRKGAILVSLNYRLGAFGFLAHPELKHTNFGLEDQRAALSWVQQHISSFGGDPNRVMIFGHSAGGISVLWQLAHGANKRNLGGELEKPLFHAALSMSGPAGLMHSGLERTLEETQSLVSRTQCQSQKGDRAEELDCLRKLPMEELLEETSFGIGRIGVIGGGFSPLSHLSMPHELEDWSQPDQIMHAGLYAPVPLILGTTTNEFGIFSKLSFPFISPSVSEAREMTRLRFLPQLDATQVEEIVRFYFEEEAGSGLALLDKMNTDLAFECMMRRVALNATLNQEKTGKPVYRYVYDYLPKDATQSMKVYHAAELPIFFQSSPGGMFFPTKLDEDDIRLSETIGDILVHFVSTGEMLEDHWLPFDPIQEHEYIFSRDSHPTFHRLSHQCVLWEKYFPNMVIPGIEDMDLFTVESYLGQFCNGFLIKQLVEHPRRFVIICCFFVLFFVGLVVYTCKVMFCSSSQKKLKSL